MAVQKVAADPTLERVDVLRAGVAGAAAQFGARARAAKR